MDAIESADGVIDYWNPAAERLYGYTAEEAIGQPSTLLVPPEKRAEFESMREKLARGERIEQFDTQRLTKGGTLIDVEISAFPVMDDTGKLAATSVISHDMTERRKLQHALEQTAQLKSDFLAKMSHEIRTPLNAIIGTTELEILSDLKPDQKRRMAIIQSSGELLLTIVDDILDYSQLAAGKMTIELEDFNLATLAEGIIEAFALSAEAKGLELVFYLEPRIPLELQGAPNRIRQVLNNLLSNAIKFTPVGEVLLRISMVEDNPQDVLIAFEVSDTGIGIAPAVQSRLFQPFVQGEQSADRRFGGYGLGLVISSQLIEYMGGAIELDSEIGKGTSFRFALRFKRREVTLPASTATPAPRRFKGIRALIVGDGAIGRSVIAQYLNSCGIESLSLANESSVIGELRSASDSNTEYSVVLLDNGADNKGFHLAQLIKRDSTFVKTKVIIISSFKSGDSSGVVDCWLAKPVFPALLFDALSNLFPLHAPDRHDSPAAVHEPSVERTALRILVVEDNLTNQALISEQLSALGCDVEIFGEATAALIRLDEQQFDIVLMDCQLPGMDGYNATAEIRRREGNHRHTYIIAFTAHVSEDQRARCLAAGMDEYLGKPLRLRTLANSLDSYLVNHGKSDQNLQAVPIEHTGVSLDPAVLAEIAQLSKVSGRNVFRKLADIFISDLAKQAQLIIAALDSGDMLALAREIHPLSSAAAIIGAMEFAAVCARVEHYASENDVELAPSLATQLLSAAQLLPAALRGADDYN
jgi:PAS domain S-box-containing protein